MDIAITKMSSKGQIVIPAELRTNIAEGDKLLVIQNEHQLIIKKVTESDENFVEDLAFAKKTENAWKRIQAKKGVTMKYDDFIKEMKRW